MVMSRDNLTLHKHIEKKKKLNTFDIVVIFASFLYPLSSIPQVISVFQGSIEGVSIYSWIGFLIFASIFFTYGIKHKIFPMLIANSIWIVMDSLVIIGYVMYS